MREALMKKIKTKNKNILFEVKEIRATTVPSWKDGMGEATLPQCPQLTALPKGPPTPSQVFFGNTLL
jgi:hypothetical protein